MSEPRVVNGVELRGRDSKEGRPKVHIEYASKAPGVSAVYVDGRELWVKRVMVDHQVMKPGVVTIELIVMPGDLTVGTHER